MEFATKLGRAVHAAWRAAHYDTAALPGIACAALDADPPSRSTTPAEIIAWVTGTRELPPQFDVASAFGQPPLTLYQDERLIVDALFWFDSTTSIHQHAFAGAFHVLAGSSLHTNQRFIEERRVGDELMLGRLERDVLEVLRPGATRAILAGSGLIHALFHLESPSITIVVRSKKSYGHDPQWEYLPPSVARAPFHIDPLTDQRLALLGAVREGHGWDGVTAWAGDLVEASDALGVLAILERIAFLAPVDEVEERVAPVFARARAAHGEIVSTFDAVIRERTRQRVIVAHRARITDPAQRFYMALLLNVDDRPSILRLLAERFPDEDPIERVIRFAIELDFGSEATEGDSALDILRHVLSGKGDEAVIEALRGDGFGEEDIAENRDAILEECAFFRSSPLFKALIEAPRGAP